MLLSEGSHVSILHEGAVIATCKYLQSLIIWAKLIDSQISSLHIDKIDFLMWLKRKAPTKSIWYKTFCDMLFTYTQIETRPITQGYQNKLQVQP